MVLYSVLSDESMKLAINGFVQAHHNACRSVHHPRLAGLQKVNLSASGKLESKGSLTT